MKKSFNKISFLLTLVFCLTSLFGVSLFQYTSVSTNHFAEQISQNSQEGSEDEAVSSSSAEDEPISSTDAKTVTISTAAELAEYINNAEWAATDNIVLSASIDMSSYTLTGKDDGLGVYSGTIGNATTPFKGTFNGNGYTISNLTIDVSATSDTTQYAGLFGYASGATIKNLSISGTTTITFGGCTTVYVGSLVAKADDCTMQNIQSTAKIVYTSSYDANVSVGIIAGAMAGTSSISQAIVRSSSYAVSLTRNDDREILIGGVVGQLSDSSSLSFMDVEVSFAVSTSSTFSGKVYVGGIAGFIYGSGTSVLNMAVQNSFSITDTAGCISSGEVVGLMTNQAPASGNLAYIYYSDNSIGRFGEQGNYTFSSSQTHDYVTTSAYSLSSLASYVSGSNTYYYYFENQDWDWQLGEWDFSTIWYVSSSTLNLQCFNQTFSVRTSSSNTSILGIWSGDALTSSTSSSCRYGETVELVFLFAAGMENYYTATTLNFGANEVATIYTSGTGSSATYSLSTTNYYTISATSETVTGSETVTYYGFIITIKSVNLATANTSTGAYTISTEAKTFNMNVYSVVEASSGDTDDDNDGFIDNVTPGYVYFSTDGATTTTTAISRSDVVYSTSYRITSKVISGEPYAFNNTWLIYVYNSSSEQYELYKTIDNSTTLQITYGSGNFDFSSDFVIYAVYTTSACEISFSTWGEGVEKVVIGETNTITSKEDAITVAKSEQSLKIQIYIKNGYTLDETLFLQMIKIYKGECTQTSVLTEDNHTIYTYNLDMTSLTDASFQNVLSLNISTDEVEEEDNGMLWWIVGGVCGGVVLIALVVLIIVLVKKRNSGFGGGGGFKTKGGFYY